MDDRWIVIPNWQRFQHYKDRVPPWIKVHTELNSNPDWLKLPLSARGLLVTLWVEYARSRGQVALSQLRLLTPLQNVYQSLKPLQDAGFIELSASKPLALARARARSREELRSSSKSARAREPAGAARARAPEQNPLDDRALPFNLPPEPVASTRASRSFMNGPVLADTCKFCDVGGGRHSDDCPTLANAGG